MNKFLRISLITLPLAVAFCLIINIAMSSIFGGLGITIGFPIPFYIVYRHNINSVPWVFDMPFLKYVDMGLVYLLGTFVILKARKK